MCTFFFAPLSFSPQVGLPCSTEIKWHPGKRLTEEVPEMESITDQLLAKTADQRSPSFFNFFDPPEYYYASYLNDRNVSLALLIHYKATGHG